MEALWKTGPGRLLRPLLIPIAALLMAGAMPAAAAATATGPQTFTVYAGAQTIGGVVQGFGFYPAVVTIAAGDTVTWVQNASEPHSIVFLNGAHLAAGRQPAQVTKSGAIMTGSGVYNSGLLAPGHTFSLNFSAPGLYLYQCGIHLDMEGVVVVLPADTPLPRTPAQVMSQGVNQIESDLNTGAQAVASTHVYTTPGPHRTLVFHVPTDVASPADWIVPLTSATRPAILGQATISLAGPGTYRVSLTATGLSAGAAFTASINLGTPNGPAIEPLHAFVASHAGTGTTSTVLHGIYGVPSRVWYVDIEWAGGTLVASGLVNYPAYGSMRYFPGVLHIRVGDSVVWTQLDPHEQHSVTFVPPGMKVPVFPTKRAVTRTPAHTYAGGFANSGLLLFGQSYSLTFTKAGTYKYTCVLHDEIGMDGEVVVAP